MDDTKVKILGICGSPIKNGNVEYMLKVALKSAEEVPGVETEMIRLRKGKLRFCSACDTCIFSGECSIFKDDEMELYFKKMEESDGVIIGVPVYIGSIPGEVATFLNRCRQYTHSVKEDAMRYKPGGVISVAWFKHSGLELSTIPLHTWMHFIQMVPVGAKAIRKQFFASPYVGAFGNGSLHGEGLTKKDSPNKHNVEYDELAMDLATDIGRRVAELAKIIKVGKKQLGIDYPRINEAKLRNEKAAKNREKLVAAKKAYAECMEQMDDL